MQVFDRLTNDATSPSATRLSAPNVRRYLPSYGLPYYGAKSESSGGEPRSTVYSCTSASLRSVLTDD